MRPLTTPTGSRQTLNQVACTCTGQKLQIGPVHALHGSRPAVAVGTLGERCHRMEQLGGRAVLQTACRSELLVRRRCVQEIGAALYAATPSAAGSSTDGLLGLVGTVQRDLWLSTLVGRAAWTPPPTSSTLLTIVLRSARRSVVTAATAQRGCAGCRLTCIGLGCAPRSCSASRRTVRQLACTRGAISADRRDAERAIPRAHRRPRPRGGGARRA